MRTSLFWIAWIFVGMGFYPFIPLHSLSISVCFTILWAIAALSRVTRYTVSPVLRACVLICCVVLVWSEYEGIRSVEATSGLFAFLCVLKLWESASARDGFLFFLIFQLMMTSQYLLLESLWLLIFIVLSTAAMCAVFMDLQKDRQSRLAFYDPEKRKVLYRLTFFSLGIAIVLFFVFPRTNFTLFINPPKSQFHPWVGFSRELTPGRITELMTDDSIIFRVSFAADSPPLTQQYWYGGTINQTDGFNWTSQRLKMFHQKPLNKSGRYPYEVVMVDSGDGPLFNLTPLTDFQLMSKGHVRFIGVADAIYNPLNAQKAQWRGSIAIDTNVIQGSYDESLLDVPDDVREFLEEEFSFLKGLSLDQATKALQDYFRRDFTYSLSPGAYEGRPLEQLTEFLTERKIGVCEHFASATGLILRTLGFPAVISVGFHGGEYNEVGDYWIVRGRDAHAWVSVFDETRGWVRFDPTFFVMPDRLTLGASVVNPQLYESLGEIDQWYQFSRNKYFAQFFKFVDSTYYKLNLAFINFDAQRQREILSQLGLDQIGRKELRNLFILITFLLITTFWLISRSRSHQRPDYWYQNKLYAKFVKKLQKLDVKVSQSMSPYHLGLMLKDRGAAVECIEFVHVFEEMKYRKSGIDRNDRKRLLRAYNFAVRTIG